MPAEATRRTLRTVGGFASIFVASWGVVGVFVCWLTAPWVGEKLAEELMYTSFAAMIPIIILFVVGFCLLDLA